MSEIRTKPSNSVEQDHYLYLCASFSDMMDAKECRHMEQRLRMIPGGWRDFCLMTSLMKKILKNLKMTYEPVKRKQMQRTADRCRHKLIIGPQVTNEEEQYVLSRSDFSVLVLAASEMCTLCMGVPSQCKGCDLGKVLDEVSFISRQNRAWWEIFEASKRRDDIGENP